MNPSNSGNQAFWNDGRFILAGLILAYFTTLWIASLFGEYHLFWRYLGVPTIQPPFADLRHITNGWDCTRQGYNIREHNACNGAGMTYPFIWLKTSFLGLGAKHNTILALGVIAWFFISVFLLIPRITPQEAWIYALVLCSPSVMLAVERGNIDMIMFSLCVGAALLLARKTSITSLAGYGAILLAGLLKLYPIAAAYVALREGAQRGLVIFTILALGFLGYLAFTFEDFLVITAMVPEPPNWAYGAKTLALQLTKTVSRITGATPDGLVIRLYIGAIMAGFLGAYLLARTSCRRHYQLEHQSLKQFLALQIGASVYIFSYIVASNFNYRLVFLIMVLPQVMEWLKSDHPMRWLHRAGLVSMVASTWLGFYFVVMHLSAIKLTVNLSIDQILEWIIFLYLIYCLFLTSPTWLRRLFLLSNASSERLPTESSN